MKINIVPYISRDMTLTDLRMKVKECGCYKITRILVSNNMLINTMSYHYNNQQDTSF